jgi:hypothetical protein
MVSERVSWRVIMTIVDIGDERINKVRNERTSGFTVGADFAEQT